MPLKRIFLCHSSADKPFVDRLASDLEKMNVGVWYDKWEIKVGDSLIDKIQKGLMENDYLIVVLSPNSIKSEWVKKELNVALIRELQEKKVIVLPCLLAECEIPPFLFEKKYADFKTSFESGFTELLIAIFPNSKPAILKSKDFRVVQFLISGLTNTDDYGTNILNAQQLKKVYIFRQELKGYLGLDEKRLLFWSALAFIKANPETPFFMNNYVPVWGLINEISEETLSEWILEGTGPHIIKYLIKYYDWAISVNDKLDIWSAKYAALKAIESYDNRGITQPPLWGDRFLLDLLAKRDPSYFEEYFIAKINYCHCDAPLIIESSGLLPEPLDDRFYLSLFEKFQGESDNQSIAIIICIIKALIKAENPLAVELIRRYKKITEAQQDELFNLMSSPRFVPGLREWFNQADICMTKLNITAALGNCGESDIKRFIDLGIETCRDIVKTDNTILFRVIGCYGDKDYADFLLKNYAGNNPIIKEAIIYALARILKNDSIEFLMRCLAEDSPTVKAAAIESLAEYKPEIIENEAERFASYEGNIYLLSALIRAIEISRIPNWLRYLERYFEHNSTLIKICVARSVANLAEPSYLELMLDRADLDDVIKCAFDEKLYCRKPFLPDWIKEERYFDPDVFRLPIRLTWPDQPRVYFQSNLDINRSLHNKLCKGRLKFRNHE